MSGINVVLDRIKLMANDVRDYILLLNAEAILKTKFEKKRRDLGSDKCPCCLQGMSFEVMKVYEKSIEELLVPSSRSSLSAGTLLLGDDKC